MIIVVGFGIAGVAAIETLRKRGDGRRVLVIGAERELAYYRPFVGHELLTEAVDHNKLLMQPESFFTANRIELELGEPVVRVLPRDAEVELVSGRRYRYSSLLVSTGAAARELDVPGAELDGVMRVRTLADGDALRSRLLVARSVVVIGGGLLGLDVATIARQMGKEVTLIERADSLLPRSLSPVMSGCVERIFNHHGVRLRLGKRVVRFRGHHAVEAVDTGDEQIAADTVVVAIGVRRALDCVRGADIRLDDGIVVGTDMRTNIPNVFAAGDVAALAAGGGLIREESFPCAYGQGSVAGANMIGGSATYHGVPTFGLMYFENMIRGIGDLTSYDRLGVRGDLKGPSAAVFAITQGRVTGIFAVNLPAETARFMTIVRSKKVMSPEAVWGDK